MARLSSLPTIPEDAALQELWVGWSLDVVEPGTRPDRTPYRDTASADSAVAPANLESCVSNLMRTPVTLSEHASLGALARLFALGTEGPVVIVSDENKPLGILTPAHVLRMVNRRPPEELEHVRLRAVAMPSGLLLQTTPLRDAAELFAAGDSDTLVVVNPSGELAGVLVARDLWRVCVQT